MSGVEWGTVPTSPVRARTAVSSYTLCWRLPETADSSGRSRKGISAMRRRVSKLGCVELMNCPAKEQVTFADSGSWETMIESGGKMSKGLMSVSTADPSLDRSIPRNRTTASPVTQRPASGPLVLRAFSGLAHALRG